MVLLLFLVTLIFKATRKVGLSTLPILQQLLITAFTATAVVVWCWMLCAGSAGSSSSNNNNNNNNHNSNNNSNNTTSGNSSNSRTSNCQHFCRRDHIPSPTPTPTPTPFHTHMRQPFRCS